MPRNLPQSVLFCCDHNAVRSPMAEGMMKKLYGTAAYVQSAGVVNDLEIDGFTIAVCAEIGVELSAHRTRSFDEMARLGDDLSSFDTVVALSQASRARALDLTRVWHLDVISWDIDDPTHVTGGREARLDAYRHSRDQIMGYMTGLWGAPVAATGG